MMFCYQWVLIIIFALVRHAVQCGAQEKPDVAEASRSLSPKAAESKFGAAESQFALAGSPLTADKKWHPAYFEAFKKHARQSGGGYSPATLLALCLQCNQAGLVPFEALAQALILAEFPQSAESKFLVGMIDPAKFCAAQAGLFRANAAVNDREVRAVLPKAMSNYVAILKKPPQCAGVLPLLALGGPEIDPKAADGADFPEDDRLIFLILLSKHSDAAKCKKIIHSQCTLKEALVLHFLEVSKDPQVRSDDEIVKFAAKHLLSQCQYEQALKFLERIADWKADFSIQFLYAWTKVLSGDAEGGRAVFEEMSQGPFTEQEIATALQSLRIVKNRQQSEREVASLLDKAVARFKEANPDHLILKFAYATVQNKPMKGECLICPAFNKVEISIFQNSNLFYYYDTSIFGTKVKSDYLDCVLKSDRQIFFPTFTLYECSPNERFIVNFAYFLMESAPYKISPIMSWTGNLAFLGNDIDRAAFLARAAHKGFFIEVTKNEESHELQMFYPEFESCTLNLSQFVFDKKNNFKKLNCFFLKITDFEYGLSFDEKTIDKKVPKADVIYKPSSELNKAALHLYKYEPEHMPYFEKK